MCLLSSENRHGVLMTGSEPFNVASRSLARRNLFNHLRTIPGVTIHAFSDLSDPKWVKYRLIRKVSRTAVRFHWS